MSVPNPALRQEVIKIYKGSNGLVALLISQAHSSPELLYLIREYPLGYDYARSRLHKAFISQAGLRDEEQIKKGIQIAEFVKKGTSIDDLSWRSLRRLTLRLKRSKLCKKYTLHRQQSEYPYPLPSRYYLKRYRTLRQRYEKP
jgi:hypothetical protein